MELVVRLQRVAARPINPPMGSKESRYGVSEAIAAASGNLYRSIGALDRRQVCDEPTDRVGRVESPAQVATNDLCLIGRFQRSWMVKAPLRRGSAPRRKGS